MRYAVAIVLLALSTIGCDKPDDVAQIRTIVEESVTMAEKQDIRGMMEHVTDDFEADPGGRDEQTVRGVLLITLRRYAPFSVKHPVPGIKVADDATTAEVSLPFLVVREGQTFPDLGEARNDPSRWMEAVADAVGDPYRLELDFVKRDDEWKVRRARIQSVRDVR